MSLISRMLSKNLMPIPGSSLGTALSSTLMHPVRNNNLTGVNFARYKSGGGFKTRADCLRDQGPKCSPKNLAKKGDCKQKQPKSMWDNPECCVEQCKDVLPRFDDLYYKPTDKGKRIYTRTWNECPEFKMREKKICCLENISPPPMQRRQKPVRPKQAQCPIASLEEQQACKPGSKNRRCARIAMPGCRPARDPPRCFDINGRPPSKCKKICAPYPSFSECIKDPFKTPRPVECNCLHVGPVCMVKK